jgi:hypothetical protein
VSDDTSLIYLEPDDEITTVVRRLRETDAPRVILVAPGRTKATTSAVGLRLVGALARDERREIVLVGDAAARSLAAEAGIAAVASVAEARSLAVGAMPASAGTAPERARISVVRGERRPVAPVPQPAEPAARPQVDRFDETRPVPVAAPAIAPPRARPRTAARRRPEARRLPGAAVAALLLLVLLGGVAGAAVVLPGATVRVVPAAQAIGPFSYDVALPVAGTEQGTLTASADGTATGEDVQLVAATGTVTFLNYTYVVVEVPQGTKVSAAGGTVVFTTTERILVPAGDQPNPFGPIVPGEGSVGIVAAEAGKGGNVPAEAIDAVERRIDSRLKGFPSQTGRRVINPDATAGGAENHRTKVEQADVDAVVKAVRADLAAQLARIIAADPTRLYPAAAASEPQVTVPGDLVGAVDTPTFTLQGTLAYAQPYVAQADAVAAARAQLDADPGAVPAGMDVLPDSVHVTLGNGTVDGSTITVAATVTAAAAARLDADRVRDLVANRSPEAARAALASLGTASVELWPGWVNEVTGVRWRIDVKLQSAIAPEPSGSPAAPSPSSTP